MLLQEMWSSNEADLKHATPILHSSNPPSPSARVTSPSTSPAHVSPLSSALSPLASASVVHSAQLPAALPPPPVSPPPGASLSPLSTIPTAQTIPDQAEKISSRPMTARKIRLPDGSVITLRLDNEAPVSESLKLISARLSVNLTFDLFVEGSNVRVLFALTCFIVISKSLCLVSA